MAEVIRMPLLSDTMKEGVIAEWNVKVGDTISADDVIAEVETDKATMDVIPYVEGTVLYIGPKKGESAKVNEVIAIVGEKGESYEDLLKESSSKESKSADKEEADKPDSAKKEKAGDKKESSPKEGKQKKGEEDKGVDQEALAKAEKNATAVRMPLLSDTMKEGKIVSWQKKEGDKVDADDVLAEVETDKATMEVIGYVDGTLLYVGVKEGEAAKVNEIIAIVGKEGTDIQPILDAESSKGGVEEEPDGAEEKQEEAPQSAEQQAEETKATSASTETADGRIKVSPLARKLAKEKGIDLADVSGSGDGGRIIKRDIDNFKPKAKEKKAGAAPFAPVGEEGHYDTSLTQMRKTIARRLAESKYTAPHFYLTVEVNMDLTMEVRKAMNDISPVKISFNDIIIKAAAMALRQHPAVNSTWLEKEGVMRTFRHIHVGSAVAMEEGLIVPVIRFADQKSLSQIAGEAKELYAKANNKKLQPQEFSGNTFTVSNLGMMGIDEFTAIINPPDSCILAVGGIKETVVVKNGEFKAANIMKLTLSCDHRVVDGAVGARFLQTLNQFIENAAAMLV